MRGRPCAVLLLALLVPTVAADDTAPPVLEEWAFASETYAPGDTVTITGRASDQSGLVVALGHLVGPGDWFDIPVHSEDCAVQQAGPFTCTFKLAATAPSGTYRLERWSMRDAVGHFGPTYHHELAGRSGFRLSMQVEGPYTDVDPPALHGVEVTTTTVQAGEPMGVRVRASDETGVASVRVSAKAVGGDRYLGMSCGDQPDETGAYACSGPTEASTPSGAYRVEQVTLVDDSGVERTYLAGRDFDEDAEHSIAFQVGGGSDDHDPPVVDSIVATPVVPRGGPWSVAVTARDNEAVHSVQVDVQTLQGTAYLGSSHCPLDPAPVVQATCSGVVSDNFPLGPVQILFVAVTDDSLNGDSWSTYTTNGNHYEVGPTMMDQFHIGPRDVSLRGGATVGVDAIDPYVLEAPPGSVLPFALRLADNATDLSFRLINEAGEVLGVQDCRSDFDPEHIGVRCRLIIPPDADGVYRLVAVGADNATAEVVDGPQHVVVTADAAPPEPLPDDWRIHVRAGVTLASFNGGLREAKAPGTPQQDGAEQDEQGAGLEDGADQRSGGVPGRVEPAPREDVPFPAAVVLPLLAALAARRR